MDNQHRKIKGYRELSQQEIDRINQIKRMGGLIEILLVEINQALEEQQAFPKDDDDARRFAIAEPMRWHKIAATDFQTGLMALTRAVAQPEFF
jgi:hypothetical protein